MYLSRSEQGRGAVWWWNCRMPCCGEPRRRCAGRSTMSRWPKRESSMD